MSTQKPAKEVLATEFPRLYKGLENTHLLLYAIDGTARHQERVDLLRAWVEGPIDLCDPLARRERWILAWAEALTAFHLAPSARAGATQASAGCSPLPGPRRQQTGGPAWSAAYETWAREDFLFWCHSSHEPILSSYPGALGLLVGLLVQAADPEIKDVGALDILTNGFQREVHVRPAREWKPFFREACRAAESWLAAQASRAAAAANEGSEAPEEVQATIWRAEE